MKKKVQGIRNHAGGIDLLTERDAGNEVRILTGKKSNSLAYWYRLKNLAEAVIDELERKEDKTDTPKLIIDSIEILHP